MHFLLKNTKNNFFLDFEQLFGHQIEKENKISVGTIGASLRDPQINQQGLLIGGMIWRFDNYS